mmetsp:Transcript_7205/g.27116  ORF Transcript_7205/g.27116 Transcript_7205/m.27116 type:complete len:109 (-) Transcript_7205:137-463(-)
MPTTKAEAFLGSASATVTGASPAVASAACVVTVTTRVLGRLYKGTAATRKDDKPGTAVGQDARPEAVAATRTTRPGGLPAPRRTRDGRTTAGAAAVRNNEAAMVDIFA